MEMLNGLTGFCLGDWFRDTASSFDAHSSRQIFSQNEFRKEPQEWWKSWKTWLVKRFKMLEVFKNRNYLLSAQDALWRQKQIGFRGFPSLTNRPKNWKLSQDHPFSYMEYTLYGQDDL